MSNTSYFSAPWLNSSDGATRTVEQCATRPNSTGLVLRAQTGADVTCTCCERTNSFHVWFSLGVQHEADFEQSTAGVLDATAWIWSLQEEWADFAH